jgi:N-alpha-acetyltransferase 15/16, NatA auxiliary subunit
MKALIIGTQGQTDAAFALAKTALGNNMKSHVCWHVYGLLYRNTKEYDESIKAYKFALRLEPESAPIQRDLAHLQIQMRDFDGYVQSRKAMLQQKPGIRQNWTALAIAHHLGGDYEEAENVLTTYEETLKIKPARSDMEHWEAVMYKNKIIAESGNLEKALDHLEAVEKRIPDLQGVLETKADYLLKLKRPEAVDAYATLLDRNPENSAYYDSYISAKGLKDDNVEGLKKAYTELAEKFPKSDLPRRRPLDFLQGDEFREAADAYLQKMLRKGVPSTFANIKQLYTDTSKKDIVQELVEGYAAKPPSQTNGDSDKKDHFESQTLYFLAQHYNYKLSRDLDKAMSYAEKCIALDESSVDAHAVKARTLKHKGDVAAASKEMDAARALDERDRAINTKCAKYQLRNDENDAALDTASKFTQNKTSGGPLGDLLEMQCVWYLTEDGQSYLRQHKLGLALKRFHQILNIFDVWQDDQFDFHNFSLRKGMIRAYIDMLRWEDHLRDHPFFSRAAVSAVEAYILLHDNPDLVHGHLMATNGSAEEMSAADRKKALKKARREQEKLEKAEADKRAAAKAAKPVPKADQEDGKKEDNDPLGKNLLETKEPLKDAMKFLTPLLEYCPDVEDAQVVGFELYRRREKWLLATRCWLQLRHLNASHEKLETFKAELKKGLKGAEGVSDKVKEIIKAEAGELLD